MLGQFVKDWRCSIISLFPGCSVKVYRRGKFCYTIQFDDFNRHGYNIILLI